MKLLLKLFMAFAKIGAFTFGGGLAMLPMLHKEVVEKHKWATEEQLTDYYAIGQCTPGIIAVNTATFIGYSQAGILGGIIATLGVVFPSIVIITIISAILTTFTEIVAVQYAFSGIRVCVCVLIFDAVLKLFKKSVTDNITKIIFLVIFIVSSILAVGKFFIPGFFTVSPIVYVIISAVAGIFLYGSMEVSK